jgi:hypothetical protein
MGILGCYFYPPIIDAKRINRIFAVHYAWHIFRCGWIIQEKTRITV